MKQDFPVWLAFLFPVFFVAMWVMVSRVISWMGWSALASRFAFDRPLPPDAARHGAQSMSIGDSLFRTANYSNCVNVWVDRNGFYMRPQLVFRLFHPMVHIRWDQIAQADVRTGFFNGGTRLTFRANVPVVLLRGRAGRAVAEQWQSHGGRSMA
ncbi:hypothetical protein L7H23_03185 [Sphingopyxis sp. BSN-002]|uniref:hypothetical protein n=1 Tax=Sphingopyxis sp. BSN-002 TaxID=2911495 RepID=UPI001EDBF392|nr:hypothetical protein [Sphingopyxis sp. BSN-002]UKK85128.1 hypothetical protein L7H23_03185 [Sphingopyxis sp. BSN-002]